MKIFLDDTRTTPDGYYRTYTVEETIHKILDCGVQVGHIWENYILGNLSQEQLSKYLDAYFITEISCDNDLGEGNIEGYQLLNWLEATGRSYPIHIHSANPVARAQMKTIIEKNNWKEVFDWRKL